MDNSNNTRQQLVYDSSQLYSPITPSAAVNTIREYQQESILAARGSRGIRPNIGNPIHAIRDQTPSTTLNPPLRRTTSNPRSSSTSSTDWPVSITVLVYEQSEDLKSYSPKGMLKILITI